ncbi:MAG: hypothetical protein [Caudoviricetes sp.]|nr:MAG: hypothetical protein [Caudoviricetes sp.]
MSKDTGGSAFPWQELLNDGNGNSWSNHHEGMSMRDYFAAKFSAAIVSKWNGAHVFDEGGISYSYCAEQAYLLADAMLKARGE